MIPTIRRGPDGYLDEVVGDGKYNLEQMDSYYWKLILDDDVFVHITGTVWAERMSDSTRRHGIRYHLREADRILSDVVGSAVGRWREFAIRMLWPWGRR